jgi:hypothetical protein
MKPNQVLHPAPEELAAFASGDVAEEQATEIGLHLADCEACRTVIETLPEDTLLSLLRQQSEAAGLPAALSPAAAAHDAATRTGPSAVDLVTAEIPPELTAHPRYEVLELLGCGGMGAVYKAEHRLMERHVALKVINPGLINRPAMVERFQREVKAAARLTHANIVTAYDAEQAGDTHVLVMEFVEGISLAQLVQQQGRLPVAQACEYIRQAALGLQHACERGMVHRDIKPHNLMRTPDGRIKILDFGLAQFVREIGAQAEPKTSKADVSSHSAGGPSGRLTEVGALMGTADFIAPEQAADPRQADIRADIYSLGCTLYYLLAGHVPFPEGTALDKLTAHRERAPKPLTKLRDDVPCELAGVIEGMMAKDPAQRYQTPVEVAEALQAFDRVPTPCYGFVQTYGQTEAGTSPVAAKAPLRRWGRRLVLAAGLLAAGLILGGIIYIATDKGEIVLKTQDENIALKFKDRGVKIRDEVTKREFLLQVGKNELRPGVYGLDVSELPEGVQFEDVQTFTLTRGGKKTLTATFKPKEAPKEGLKEAKGYLLGEALSWFPENATFFGGRDLRAFRQLSVQQFITLMHLVGHAFEPGERERLLVLVQIMGQIDRVTFAFVRNRQEPAKSQIFIRVTGKINHQRLADWFRKDWPGATIRQEGTKGVPITVIGNTQPVAPGFAIIGTTDFLLAGYEGVKEKHMEVLDQALALQAGWGASSLDTQTSVLREIPENAWAFMAGEPPEVLKDLAPFRALPRRMALSVSGTSDVKFQLQADFPSAGDARTFVDNLAQLKRQGVGFATKPTLDPEPSPLLKPVARLAFQLKPEVSQLLVGTLNSMQVEADGDRARAALQVSSKTVDLLTEALQDLPLSLFNHLANIEPGGEPVWRADRIKAFGPAAEPITRDGVTADQGGWRIEAKGNRTVALFEIHNPGIHNCTVIYRARLKTANLQGRAYLEMWCRLPGSGEFFSRGLFHPVSGTTDWATYQTPFLLEAGQRPELIKLNVVVEGKGTVWIEDLELLRGPLPATTASPKGLGKPIKMFHPTDKTVTKDRVFSQDEGWLIESGEKEVRTVHLFEVLNPGVEQCLVLYRFQMKTSLRGHAYQEMWCRLPGQGESFSKGFDHMAAGNTDWTTYVIPFRLEKGQRPDLVKLDLVVAGLGKVWIRNVELLQIPLAP